MILPFTSSLHIEELLFTEQTLTTPWRFIACCVNVCYPPNAEMAAVTPLSATSS